MKACGAVIGARKNRGRLCGRPAVAFVAPGVGRCGFHDTAMERTRALAVFRAVRETFDLRGCPREPEDEQQPDSDQGTDSEAVFDPSGFADPSLDEE